MLKLTYIESGLHMERVAAPLEVLVAQRVILALRANQRLHMEPGQASFLVTAKIPGLAQLEKTLRLDQNQAVAIAPVDDDYLEMTVQGNWLAETADADEGIFITALSHQAEFLVMHLWQASQFQVSSLA